jgi:hypothetical protein
MPIVPTKGASKECELSFKTTGYLDMDGLDDSMKDVSLLARISKFFIENFFSIY